MKSFRQYHLSIAQTFSNALKVREALIINDDLIIIIFKDSQRIIAVNHNLETLWTRDVDMHTRDYVYPTLTVRKDARLYSIADIDTVRLFSIEGELLFTFPHEAWYSFLGTGSYFQGDSVLFVAPLSESDWLLLVDTRTFQVLHKYKLDGYQEYNYSFHATPSPDIIFLDLAAGQDDTRLFSVQCSKEQLHVTEMTDCNDQIFGAFSPSGKEFATAPHYNEGIKVFSFPSGKLIAEISQEQLFEDRNEYPAENEDSLNYKVMYLNDETLLAITRFGRLLLIRRATMTCFGELLLEGCKIVPYNFEGALATEAGEIEDYEGEVSDVQLLSDNSILVNHSDGRLMIYHREAGL